MGVILMRSGVRWEMEDTRRFGLMDRVVSRGDILVLRSGDMLCSRLLEEADLVRCFCEEDVLLDRGVAGGSCIVRDVRVDRSRGVVLRRRETDPERDFCVGVVLRTIFS